MIVIREQNLSRPPIIMANSDWDVSTHRDFDIVVIGATGFTGKLIVAEYFNAASPPSVAIAGRSTARLAELNALLGSDFPVIEVDVESEDSLRSVVARTHCVINCVGPFAIYGERVVAACVAEGTHYVDINGEPVFMSQCRSKFDAPARSRAVMIVQACGMDSVPADLGVKRTEDLVIEAGDEPDLVEGAVVPDFALSPGTFRTLINSFKAARSRGTDGSGSGSGSGSSGSVKSEGPGTPGPVPSPAPARVHVQKMRHEKDFTVDGAADAGWLVPFPVADPSVVRYTHKMTGRSDITYHHFALCKSRFQIMYFGLLSLLTWIFARLTAFAFGRVLFEQFIAIFIPGPSKEMQTKHRTHLYFKAVGKAGAVVKTELELPEAYRGTAIMAIHCAECLLDAVAAAGKLKVTGGVHTPMSGLGDALEEKMAADDRFAWKTHLSAQ